MTTKIVINKSCGEFELSKLAIDWLKAKGITDKKELSKWICGAIPRHSKLLVELVEELGEDANADSYYSDLVVREVELPSGRYYVYVDEYDGTEEIKTPESLVESFDWATV